MLFGEDTENELLDVFNIVDNADLYNCLSIATRLVSLIDAILDTFPITTSPVEPVTVFYIKYNLFSLFFDSSYTHSYTP